MPADYATEAVAEGEARAEYEYRLANPIERFDDLPPSDVLLQVLERRGDLNKVSTVQWEAPSQQSVIVRHTYLAYEHHANPY
jgi:hypothetical protein